MERPRHNPTVRTPLARGLAPLALAALALNAAAQQSPSRLGPAHLAVGSTLDVRYAAPGERPIDFDAPFASLGSDVLASWFVSRHVDATLGPGATARRPVGDEPGLDDARFEIARVASTQGVLELTDGQRLIGTLYTPTDQSDTPSGEDVLRWVPGGAAAWLAEGDEQIEPVEVQLERVRRVLLPIARNRGRVVAPGAEDDVLTYANGDRVTGFIVSLDPEITIESEGNTITVDRDVIGSVTLANPDEPLDAPTVWLADGSAVSINGARFEQSATGPIVLDTEHFGPLRVPGFTTMVYASEPGRIVPLARLAPEQSGSGSDRYFIEPIERSRHPDDALPIDLPPLGVLDVTMPGPMRLAYDVPEGATGLIATVELPKPSNPWANCDLIVEADGVEVQRITLTPGASAAPLRVELSGAARLELRLDEREHGPIGDRVILRRPMFILER
jgi:hypothetical protein